MYVYFIKLGGWGGVGAGTNKYGCVLQNYKRQAFKVVSQWQAEESPEDHQTRP